jgi:hypothetical protein
MCAVLSWPPAWGKKVRAAYGYGLCVSVKHMVIVATVFSNDGGHLILVHSLDTGEELRSFGSMGSGPGEFNFSSGGLCTTPSEDTFLLADGNNNRLQELRVADGAWVRSLGEGVLDRPLFVDCNTSVIAVTQAYAGVAVMSLSDGARLAQFGRFSSPHGLRLLGDGSGVVVTDMGPSKCNLTVFTLDGTIVCSIGSFEQGFRRPFDVLECVDTTFLVALFDGDYVVRVSREGRIINRFLPLANGAGNCCRVLALAALPSGGLVVRDSSNIHLFRQ